MSCEVVISDWNGTIINYRDEKPVLEAVAAGVFMNSAPFSLLRMARILKARRDMEALYREKRRDGSFDFVREMFHIYNQRIIKGLPITVVHEIVDSYAGRPRTQAGLDLRILRPIRECYERGKTTGIFSAGFRYGITSILRSSGYFKYFHFCEADDLDTNDGRAAGFPLKIYRRKSVLLPDLLTRHGLDASRTAYIGDSEDDEGCFEIVRYPVVPFLAPDHVKETYARKYRAFVPESEQELRDFLAKA